MSLNEFIVKAKKNTYASGKPPKKLEDGFEEFTFKEGKYNYRDRYHAIDPKPFGGQECVWENGKLDDPIWIMNYYGYILSDKAEHKEVYGFLRKAMSLVNEKIPFRGPVSFKEGDFEYMNKVSGDVNRFKGIEKIKFKGKVVYVLEYHGGVV
jgi:hypothetical protein